MKNHTENHSSFRNALTALLRKHQDSPLTEQLKQLADERPAPCLSVYMPIERSPLDRHQNELRWRQAEKRIKEHSAWSEFSDATRDSISNRLQDLTKGNLTDTHEGAALGLFLSADTDTLLDLPVAVDERLTISSAFDLIPLAEAWLNDQAALLLELTQNRVRLYRLDPDGMKELALPEVPETIQDLLKFEDADFHLQFHTRTDPSPHGRRDAVYHSQGGEPSAKKDQIRRFCQHIDKGLNEHLSGSDIPLILAGVEYVLAIFRHTTNYPNICDAEVHGNPETSSETELYEQAQSILQKDVEEQRRAVLEAFEEVPGDVRLDGDLGEILQAAQIGRLGALFVPNDKQTWGQPKDGDATLSHHDEPEVGDQELYSLAAARTIRNGGTVIPVPSTKLTADGGNGEPVAGVQRF